MSPIDHSTRLARTGRAEISPEGMARHKASREKYPQLALSAGEYVVEEIRRHPIGILGVWAVVILIVLALLAFLPYYGINLPTIAGTLGFKVQNLPSAATLVTPVLILAGFVVLGGVIATIIYYGNRFYLTNESVFQYVQTGLFSTKSQVINLINVEDVSAAQEGPFEQILDFGTLRLSTQGEHTTYHFYFVANPRRVVNLVNDATEKAVLQTQGVPVTEY